MRSTPGGARRVRRATPARNGGSPTAAAYDLAVPWSETDQDLCHPHRRFSPPSFPDLVRHLSLLGLDSAEGNPGLGSQVCPFGERRFLLRHHRPRLGANPGSQGGLPSLTLFGGCHELFG